MMRGAREPDIRIHPGSFAPKNLKSDPMKRLRGKCAAVDLVGCDVRDTRYPVAVSEGTGRGR